MELRVEENEELEGSGQVALPAELGAEIAAGDTLRLVCGTRSCGAIVAGVGGSPPGLLQIDKYLRLHLHVRPGDLVRGEPWAFPDAEDATVAVPPGWAAADGMRLLARLLCGRPVCAGQETPVFTISGTRVEVRVTATRPPGIVMLGASTSFSCEAAGRDAEPAGITYGDIGGLDREIRRVRELIEYPLRSPQAFAHLGIQAPRGIILYGPPGTGKTLIARALSNEVGAHFYTIQGPEIVSGLYGESERRLREVFEQARTNAPAVILMDELDALAVRRDQTRGELEQRLVASLLSLMDGLSELQGVVVVGTTNRLNAIDAALRRPGRFEHEIHVGVPDPPGRRQILGIHTRRMPLAPGIDVDDLAARTPGFVGADLAALCAEAGYSALRRAFPPELLERGEVFPDPDLQVTAADFATALAAIRPSALREVTVQVPRDVSWDDIGGLEDVKQAILENVVYGIQKAPAYRAMGIRPARGLLLYGPPGTGKTLLARAVANRSGANFIAVRGPELRSKWFGESEEKVRFIFAKAREVAPCVIFFDEIDAVAPARGRDVSGLTDTIVNQLLTEMDGIETSQDLFVIGATNMADLLDPALLRPGRFDLQILVPLPDLPAREAVFRVHLRRVPLAAGVDVPALAAAAEGRSGADIAEVCRQGAMYALRESGFAAEGGTRGRMAHLQAALDDVARTHKSLAPRRLGFKLPRQEG